MSKKFISTSKQEYITPKIFVEELEKQDVLMASEGDNNKTEANQMNHYYDLFTSIFEGD